MNHLRSGFIALLIAVVGSSSSARASTATAVVGRSASFSVSANGTAPFSYQWKKNNVSIAGAVGRTYTIASVTTADAGTYTVTVSNSAGSTLSDAAVLNVTAANPGGPPTPTPPPPTTPLPPSTPTPPTPPPPTSPPPTSTLTAGHLTNLSVRGLAGSGSQTLIVGFIVTGTNQLPVLIRGWGPTLAADPFNVSGALSDPILRVIRDGTQMAENDNWSGDAQLTAITSQVGAYAFPRTSKDAAVFTSFAPGGNTAHILDATASAVSGVALAEVFDANPSYTAGSPRLTNLSARAQVGTGSNVLIGGFVISGQTPLTVLIRAVGPSLASFGVSGILADPKLELHSGASLLQTNDNWSEASNASTIATLNGQQAFALPANSKDAVILTTLQPGVYSAVITGANNSVGTALLELYEVR